MIDAHVHIDEYGKHLPRALDQIKSHSIRTLAVSMDIPSYRRAQEIAGETGFPDLLGRVKATVAGLRQLSRSRFSEQVAVNFDAVLQTGGVSFGS